MGKGRIFQAATWLVLAPAAFGQAGPANDTCTNPFGPVSDGFHFVDTTGATESGVQPLGLPPFVDDFTPNTQCENINGFPEDMNVDVWLEFVPVGSGGSYYISTCNMASYNTKLAIYSGTCGAPVALACNDSSGGCLGFESILVVEGLNAGSSYLVQAGAAGGATGTATLSFTHHPAPPPNDECTGATPVQVGMNLGVDTTAATTSQVAAAPLPPYVDNVTPNTACDPSPFAPLAPHLGNDVWFTFLPSASGDYLFSTCNLSDYNTKLALFSGSCGNEVPLACNKNGDGCAFASSNLRVSGLMAGQQYLLVVGGNGSSIGMTDLWIEREGAVGSSYCAALPNSVSPAGAPIAGTGTASFGANDLVLQAGPIEAGQPALFYYGPNQLSVPFGDGLRCVGGAAGTVSRLFPFSVADAAGELSYVVDNTHPVHAPQLQAGTTWNFQAWYRDPAAGLSGFNLSNGLEVTFGP